MDCRGFESGEAMIRPCLMCLDLLERGEIVTFREKKKRLEYVREHIGLPDESDYRQINEFGAILSIRRKNMIFFVDIIY